MIGLLPHHAARGRLYLPRDLLALNAVTAEDVLAGRMTPGLRAVLAYLAGVAEQHLANARIHNNDALDVLERLPDASLDRAYLLHPDPWPKARHAKRRMVNPGPLDLIAAKLKPGGEFRLGTDDPTYCRWAMMVMNGRRDLAWQAKAPPDFLERPEDWPETRYERKARRHGHEVWYFRYRRM